MNLTSGQKTALLALILQFTIMFAMNPPDLELTHLMKHDIDVGDAISIDKPKAKRFLWHIDYAKLAHTADSTSIELNPTNDQLRKLQTKAKIQYPIEYPAQQTQSSQQAAHGEPVR